MSDDRFTPQEKVTPEAAALQKIEECASKFRESPRQRYMVELAKEMATRLKPLEIDKMLQDLHRKKEIFPAMVYFEEEIKKVERAKWVAANPERSAIKKKPEPYKKRVEAYPISLETLFVAIKDSKTEHGGFNYIRRMYARFTDDQIWAAYELWLEGKPHPDFVPQDKLKDEKKTNETISSKDLFG